MLKLNYFLADIFILSAEKQPIKLSWRKIEWLRGLLLRARITQVVGECIVEFTGVDVCRIEVAELYVEESIQ